MISIGANLKEADLVARRDLQTHFLERGVYLGIEHDPTILGRTHQVVKQN